MSKDPTEVIENHPMPVTCPKCSHTVKKPIKWIRNNTSLKCEGCESDIDLTNKERIAADDAFEEALKEVMATQKDLKIVFF